MPCDPAFFENIPIFSLLDADERAVLADQVELRRFTARQRIYRAGEPGQKAYVLLSGRVQVVVIDEDIRKSSSTPRSRRDLRDGLDALRRPAPEHGGRPRGDGHHRDRPQRHRDAAAAQADGRARHADDGGPAVPTRAGSRAGAGRRNPNEVIAETLTFGDRLADSVARFGGSWRFIITFGASSSRGWR
jgi:CRP-like cAMP-binding protein